MYEINNKIGEQKYENLKVQVVAKTSSFDILSISLEKDAIFPEHTSPSDAQLIVLEGSIIFSIDNKSYELSKHQTFAFSKYTAHWVKARENSKFLIVR